MSDFDVSLTPAAAINVSIAGGVGPQGPAGAGGVVSLNGATGALTLAAVGGSWAVAGTTITLTVSAGASTWSALTGKPFSSIGSGLSVDGSGVLSATGLTSVSWGDITGKPATFAPSAHTHVIADTTGLQAALDAKAPLASPTFTGTVSGVTAAMVGLGSVDNVADASKPVSTAQAAADAVVQAYAIQRANHTGTQAVGTITGLAAVATSGAYADLSGKPTTYARRFAWSSPYSYSGRAATGSATSAAVWTIKRTQVSTSGGITATLTATSVAWNDYATASYS